MSRTKQGVDAGRFLRLLKRGARPIPSAEDWEAARALRYKTAAPAEALVDFMADLSWLSMVCFVEAIDPGTVGLSEELLARVQRDLKRIEERDTLEMYWSCLERLRHLELIDEREANDALDSE